MPELHTDIRYIKGIGEQRAKALAKLDIFTLRDLISYFPRTYDDRRGTRAIATLCNGETVCVEAMVSTLPTLQRIRKGMELLKTHVVDASGTLDLVFFNQVYLRDTLRVGETYTFFGKVDGEGKRKRMTNPVVERLGSHTVTGRIVPIYPLSSGVTQNFVRKAMEQGLRACRDLLPDILPNEVRYAHNLCHISYAYEKIHFPENEEELSIARRRLVFEELFLLAIGLKQLRRRREVRTCVPFTNTNLQAFYEQLPFSLTNAQQRAIDEVLSDFRVGKPMNRLVQGDVGSGKTMVAAAAIVCAVQNGRQATLMAPTEILAEQHYRGLAPLLDRMNIPCALLTGGTGARERRRVLSELASGEICVAIGTHALISADVTYCDLGLVVTDEQHRFGVAQRAALSAKGTDPHLLVMSATPIPRTLALMIYGDLDVSVIDQLPPGRQKIDTFSVTGAYRQRIYQFLRKEIASGRQAYIICSMVEQHDTTPDERMAATAYTEFLRTSVFPDLRIACVHGRMKAKDKDQVMRTFSAGDIDILVSTTVVEVGVDVPNATVMVVEDADRFGLSQLHQLRGRVGRGQYKSYCILISDNKNEETRQRLKVMAKTSDGFQVAEEDLRLRGPGDFFGQRQHGLPTLKVADLHCDMALLHEAQTAAHTLLTADPALTHHPLIAQHIHALFDSNASSMN